MKLKLMAALLIICVDRGIADDPFITNGLSLRHYIQVVEKSGKNEKLNEDDLQWYTAGLNYLKGYLDGVNTATAAGGNSPFRLPENVSILQITLVIKKTLNDHPEILDSQAVYIVMGALRDAFPNPDYKPIKP